MVKISALPTNTAPALDDEIVHNDVSASTTKRVTVLSVLQMLHPVGSLYFNAAVSTNPATLLGFGTWVAHAAGRMLVGVDGSDTDFDTVGDTGGEKTHVLSWNEMPVHNHGVNDPGHGHSFSLPTLVANGGSGLGYPGGGSTWHYLDYSGNVNGSGTGISTQNAGSNSAANNMPPFIAVYVWRRTA